MRFSPEHKEQVRARIVDEASRALREKGLNGVSVPALMERVGLTHGGFYNHFADRDALVAEAVTLAANETGASVFDAHANDPDGMLAAYLSPEHLASPEHGCVIAALGAEAVHAPSPRVRHAFAAAARGFITHVQRLISPKSRARPDDATLRTASQMIGAVVLARLVDDPALSARILSAARTAS